MIKASDLRIGNFILPMAKILEHVTVTDIDEDGAIGTTAYFDGLKGSTGSVVPRTNHKRNRMNKNNSSLGSIGFSGMLTITFIVMKLFKVINWSWYWVTCPIWGLILLIVICYLIYLPFTLYKERKCNRLGSRQ